jgi:hypothetical protein
MKVMALGLDYSTRKLLVDPLDEQAFAGTLLDSLRENVDEIRKLTTTTTRGTTFRGGKEIQRKVVDFGDPMSVGWTFLVSEKDPRKNEIIDAMRPLAQRRNMKNPDKPLILNTANDEDEWLEWLQENYFLPDVEQPHYVLVVGDPQLVPFRFQSILATAAAVGRLDFDSIEDLKAYVDKVIRLESAEDPVVAAETVFFAPDGGPQDPTYFSRHFMAAPLAQDLKSRTGFKIHELFGNDATKSRLQKVLSDTKPALLYTASHGLGAQAEPLETQKKVNGGICCQQTEADSLYTAADVPFNKPFLEGAIVFQFACFGYGTPADSDYAHWLGKSNLNTQQDFVAALPKRLLAHPNGPIAFVGHLDLAWIHGFDDPETPGISDVWNPRIEPFKNALQSLLGVDPSGKAMSPMATRYDLYNALLTNVFDRMQRGKLQITAEFQKKFVNNFITRSDAQNYMILGDPAARLRIPQD